MEAFFYILLLFFGCWSHIAGTCGPADQTVFVMQFMQVSQLRCQCFNFCPHGLAGCFVQVSELLVQLSIELVFCPASKAEQLLVVMQNTDEGKDAAIIGEVTQCNNHFVQLKTAFGGTRMVDWINGEQLPRIC